MRYIISVTVSSDYFTDRKVLLFIFVHWKIIGLAVTVL